MPFTARLTVPGPGTGLNFPRGPECRPTWPEIMRNQLPENLHLAPLPGVCKDHDRDPPRAAGVSDRDIRAARGKENWPGDHYAAAESNGPD